MKTSSQNTSSISLDELLSGNVPDHLLKKKAAVGRTRLSKAKKELSRKEKLNKYIKDGGNPKSIKLLVLEVVCGSCRSKQQFIQNRFYVYKLDSEPVSYIKQMHRADSLTGTVLPIEKNTTVREVGWCPECSGLDV